MSDNDKVEYCKDGSCKRCGGTGRRADYKPRGPYTIKWCECPSGQRLKETWGKKGKDDDNRV